MTYNETLTVNGKMESALKRVYEILNKEFDFTPVEMIKFSLNLARVNVINLEMFYTVENKPVEDQIKAFVDIFRKEGQRK